MTYLERRVFHDLIIGRIIWYALLAIFETLNLLKSDYLHYEVMRYLSLKLFGWSDPFPPQYFHNEYFLLISSYVALSTARCIGALLLSLLCSPFYHTLISFLATTLYWFALDHGSQPVNTLTYDDNWILVLFVCRALAFNAFIFKRWVSDELTTCTDTLNIWTREERLQFAVLRQLIVGVVPNLLKILVFTHFDWIVFGAQREIITVALVIAMLSYLLLSPYYWVYDRCVPTTTTMEQKEQNIGLMDDRRPPPACQQHKSKVFADIVLPPRFNVVSKLRVNCHYWFLHTVNSLLLVMQQLLYVAYLVYAHLLVGLDFCRDLVYCHTISHVMKMLLNGLYVRFVDRHALTGGVFIYLYGWFGFLTSTGIAIYLYFTRDRLFVEACSVGLCLLSTISFLPMYADQRAKPVNHFLDGRRDFRSFCCVFLVRTVRFCWPLYSLPPLLLFAPSSIVWCVMSVITFFFLLILALHCSTLVIGVSDSENIV